jgi:hypothetical protein
MPYDWGKRPQQDSTVAKYWPSLAPKRNGFLMGNTSSDVQLVEVEIACISLRVRLESEGPAW